MVVVREREGSPSVNAPRRSPPAENNDAPTSHDVSAETGTDFETADVTGTSCVPARGFPLTSVDEFPSAAAKFLSYREEGEGELLERASARLKRLYSSFVETRLGAVRLLRLIFPRDLFFFLSLFATNRTKESGSSCILLACLSLRIVYTVCGDT